jgi:hypothetical protein
MIFRQPFEPQSSTYTYLLADKRSRDAVISSVGDRWGRIRFDGRCQSFRSTEQSGWSDSCPCAAHADTDRPY